LRTISRKPVGVAAVSQRFDSNGRTIWIVDAHRGFGKRFVLRADEKLTAFLDSKKSPVMLEAEN
jgi:hypothetical protein